nr:hypothetical protein [uncultured Cohaesibacter sp.]
MYIQRCVKGIAGTGSGGDGITKDQAFEMATDGRGIVSNWLRKLRIISPRLVEAALTDDNLDRHLHDYENFGADTPFISLACGAVERNALERQNYVYLARDTALMFATEDWTRPGALFYVWVPVSHNRAVEIRAVAEPVRDLNIYRRWSPYQLEGEITAKVNIPANQIEKVEWWDGRQNTTAPVDVCDNTNFIAPTVLSNIRDLF